MKSPELQELTASEPLSLDEEYEMQQAWMNDENSMISTTPASVILECTFILLSSDFKSNHELGNFNHGGMVGDVNCFFHEEDGSHASAEIEVMIAEPDARRRGIATEALQLMITYAFTYLQTKTFEAKILDKNHSSIKMFEKLGFNETSRVPVFSQVNYGLDLTTIHAPSWLDSSQMEIIKSFDK